MKIGHGGGGGRIVLNFTEIEEDSLEPLIKIHGGTSYKHEEDMKGRGGSGTYYNCKDKTLYVDNDSNYGKHNRFAPTPLESSLVKQMSMQLIILQ